MVNGLAEFVFGGARDWDRLDDKLKGFGEICFGAVDTAVLITALIIYNIARLSEKEIERVHASNIADGIWRRYGHAGVYSKVNI